MSRKSSKQKIPETSGIALTDEELYQVRSGFLDVRCAVKLAQRAAVSGDVQDMEYIAGVLDMATREMERLEDSLDPITVNRARAAEAAHG